ncbi:MAG: hypothetical protein V4850_31895 [Myxococcota bacterium]
MRMVGLLRDLEPRATAALPSLSALRGELGDEHVERVVAYLRSGEIASDAMEIVVDPFDSSVQIAGGSGLQSDGVWVWRQDLWHYVLRYRIGLPREFIDHTLRGEQAPLSAAQCGAAMEVSAKALRPPDPKR